MDLNPAQLDEQDAEAQRELCNAAIAYASIATAFAYSKLMSAALRFAAIRRPTPTTAAQGGETREAVARHLCLLKTGRDSFTGWDLIHEADKANWRGEADKILSLIHPQSGREEAK